MFVARDAGFWGAAEAGIGLHLVAAVRCTRGQARDGAPPALLWPAVPHPGFSSTTPKLRISASKPLKYLQTLLPALQAQGLAVDLRGTGQLAGVRAIYSTGHALVWLEVDSANSRGAQAAGGWGNGSAPESVRAAEAGRLGAAADSAGAVAPGGLAPLPPTPAPSWAALGFDAATFQRKAAALAAALAAPPAGRGAAAQLQSRHAAEQHQVPRVAGSMAQKAEEWCVHHHSSLAGRGDAPSAAAGP